MTGLRCFIGLLGAVLVSSAQAATPCPPFPMYGWEVLNAVREGVIVQRVACGLRVDDAVWWNGGPVTPLQYAASIGDPQIIDQVIAAGADVHWGGPSVVKLLPLEVALSSRHFDAARRLIERGARADYQLLPHRTTSLMVFAFSETFDEDDRTMVRDLIARGARVDATDVRGDTALHFAARSGKAEMASTLIELGADTCARNGQGQTPQDAIWSRHRARMVSLVAPRCEAAPAAAIASAATAPSPPPAVAGVPTPATAADTGGTAASAPAATTITPPAPALPIATLR